MFNVSISIDDTTVSTKINGVDDFWPLMIPALLARGFEFPFQIMFSLHDFIETDGKFIVISKEDFDLITDGVKKDGFEEGVASARSNTEALVDDYDKGYETGWDKGWQAGYEAGLLAGKCNAA